MAWTSVRVRPATASDVPALLGFASELRDQLLPASDAGGARGRTPAGGARQQLEARYLEALADPDRHLVIATGEGGEPLGMALFTVATANPLLDIPAVHVSHAVVADRHRRRGAGKALVAAAAAFAEERGLDQLVVSVHPGSREANRFFARLGFAPLAVRRVAPVGVVRRRLTAGEIRLGSHSVHRRARRLPTGAPALPLGPVDPEP